jgi:murein DD-endopeptidase MepM/ murein hydrolase activator NlpD
MQIKTFKTFPILVILFLLGAHLLAFHPEIPHIEKRTIFLKKLSFSNKQYEVCDCKPSCDTIVEPHHIPMDASSYVDTLSTYGGGITEMASVPCISDSMHEVIRLQSISNMESLGLNNTGAVGASAAQLLAQLNWPLAQAPGFNDPSYYVTSNYVDHDTTSGVRDYNCGTRTYNGHRGTDIALWPFSWHQQITGQVDVVAAQSGIIINKFDGNFDQNCSCVSNNWNGIIIRHPDGSVAWYGHFKNGSITSKAIGQTVVQGEYLGKVGSSGCSTGPHLHFELYANSDQTILVDPYAGTCNSLNGNTSWWSNQKPYAEPNLNKLMTHDCIPQQPGGCPANNDVMCAQNVFSFGDTIRVSASYRDAQAGDLTSFTIRRPNNTVWTSWSHTSPQTYLRSGWYWSRIIPSSEPSGVWTFQASYRGQTATHNFTISSSAPANDLCANAINISCGQSLSGTTVGAGTSGAPAGTCNANQLNVSSGVWYRFTGNGQAITASVCNSNYNTQIGVYAGSCGNLTCVTSDDDGCGTTSAGSQVTFNSANGTIYYIYVTGYLTSDTGNFTLQLSCAAPPTLSISSSTLNPGAGAGSSTINVTSNCNLWSVSGAPSWMTVSPTSDNGNATVTIQYQANTSTQSRTATLTFSGCGLTQTVTITQTGVQVTLTVSPGTLSLGAAAGSTNVNVTSNCNTWSVSGAPSWITVSPASGNGYETVTIQYQENTTGQIRSAMLTVSGCGIMQTISITQSTLTITSDVEEITSLISLNIIPNPTSGLFTLSLALSTAENIRISLINSSGQVLQTIEDERSTGGNYHFDLSNNPGGLYLLKITTGKGYLTRSIILTK